MTSSLLDVRRGSQTPRVANYPPYPFTAAPEVIDLAAEAGLHLDEWQQYVLTHGLGQRLDEAWTARKVSVWVPRQNGKGGIIEALELAWLFLFDEELIVHSAHQHRTSQKAYERLERIIRRTPRLHRQVAQYRQANGEQQIELHDGRMLQYTTRSRTAVRGFSAPKIVLDEAQELTDEQIAAMMPTVSAMPNWQIWFFGTPPDDDAAWVYGLKEDGEAGAPRIAHFDWGLQLDLDDPADRAKVHDRANWYRTNPAAGIRIAEETIEDEAKPSGLGTKFPQERLGVWKPRAVEGNGVIDMAQWLRLGDATSARTGGFTIAFDVTPERDRAAISMRGNRADGLAHWEVMDVRPGIEWLVRRLIGLKEKWNPIAFAVDGKGPAASIIPDLIKAGIKPPEDKSQPKRGDLLITGPQDMADAFGMLVDAVRQERGRHRDQAELTAALSGAKTRPLGDGGQAWGRKGSTLIAPLVGVTLANYVHELWAHLVVEDGPPNLW